MAVVLKCSNIIFYVVDQIFNIVVKDNKIVKKHKNYGMQLFKKNLNDDSPIT